MTCRHIKGEGFTAIVCTRGQRTAACSVKGCSRKHVKLCDFPLQGRKKGRTCDAKLCDQHATNVGPDRDYCPPHARRAEP